MLIFVRHGQTLTNAEGRLLGREDPPLTELGRRQAAALASTLTSVTKVVSSPLARAVATAEAIGGPVHIDERWIEMDYGEFEGRRIDEVPREVWAQWRGDVSFRPPGGESIESVGERVRQACEEVALDAVAHDIVVVSHVSPIKSAIAWALGVGDEIAWRTFLNNASICRVAIGPNGPSVRSFNECHHLDGLA